MTLPGHAAKGTDDIPPVGPNPSRPCPRRAKSWRQHTTVGGQDPTEMGARLHVAK